jgi:hypothetical protein
VHSGMAELSIPFVFTSELTFGNKVTRKAHMLSRAIARFLLTLPNK